MVPDSAEEFTVGKLARAVFAGDDGGLLLFDLGHYSAEGL